MSDNPYAPPEATELRVPAAMGRDEAMALRFALRSAERLVRSIGLVYFVQAAAAFTAAVFMLMPGPPALAVDALYTLSSAAYLFVLTLVLAMAGYGLVVLATWSRLCALIQTFFLLGGFMFGLFTFEIESELGFIFAVLHSLPFYILFGPKAGYVLAPRYAAVVAATPDRRPGSVLLALGIATIFAALIATDILVFAGL